MMDNVNIFISHSSKDKELAQAFAGFLESVAYVEVFCSSIKGNIAIGDDFVETIMNKLKQSSVFIPLISKNYHKSEYCLMELGIAYSYFYDHYKERGQSFITPFFVPPEDATTLRDTPLRNLQVYSIRDIDEISQFIECLEKQKGVSLKNSRNSRCISFIRKVNEILVGIDSVTGSAQYTAFRAPNVKGDDSLYLSYEETSRGFSLEYNMNPFEGITEQPEYIGFCLGFPNMLNLFNAADIYDNARFECLLHVKESLLKRIVVEFKYSQSRNILDKIAFSLKPGENRITVPLGPMKRRAREAMQEISEICFVLHPSDTIAGKGSFSLDDIDICYS